MKLKSYSLKFFNSHFLKKKHQKRRRKQRKRHAETFFYSRRKKFIFYYVKFSRRIVLKQKKLNDSLGKNQSVVKYNIGLKALNLDYVTTYPLRAVIKVSKRYSRINWIDDYIKYKMSIFADFWLTAKPKAVRMGKGKGEIKRKIYFLQKGEILYELRFLYRNLQIFKNRRIFIFLINLYIKFLLFRLQHKYPIKNKIFKKKL
jgi:ribosomal protein L16/L10AE